MIKIELMSKNNKSKKDVTIYDFTNLFQGVEESPNTVMSLKILNKFKNDLKERDNLDTSLPLGKFLDSVMTGMKDKSDRTSSQSVMDKIYYVTKSLSVFIDFLNTFPRFNVSRATFNSAFLEILNQWAYSCTLRSEEDTSALSYSKMDYNKKLNNMVANLDLTTVIAYIFNNLGYPAALYFIFVLESAPKVEVIRKDDDDN